MKRVKDLKQWWNLDSQYSNKNWFVCSSYTIGIVSLLVSIYTWRFPIQDLQSKTQDIQEQTQAIQANTNEIQDQLNNVQRELNSENAARVLQQYFTYIEQGDYQAAWNIFTDNKQLNTDKGFEEFKNGFKILVAFEGLKITEIVDRRGASSQAFIAEFNFKQRGMLPLYSVWDIGLKYLGDKWKIDYIKSLYQNNQKPNSCEFYTRLDSCIIASYAN